MQNDRSNPRDRQSQRRSQGKRRQGAEARRMKPLRVSRRRPLPPSVRVASAEFKVPNFASSLLLRRRPKTSSQPPTPIPRLHYVFRRQTQRKQGQEGCSVHRHGGRSVLSPVSLRVECQRSLLLGCPCRGVRVHPMCLGASGTGRTTFVNTLCESEVLPHKVCDTPETAHTEEGIRIKPANVGTCPSFVVPR